jgi:ABC-type lipoprotein release transport system permease subunit
MSTLCLISLSIKDATNRASKETFGNITNSFSMEINRRVNFGTPRGGGNIKGQDIKKIAESKDIDSYVKRINSVADLVDNDIIETQKTLSNQSPERAKNFKRAVMLTGVNDSSKENKFISGAYKLSSGEHLNENDKNKILMHKDLAEKNNLKIGDKIKIKSNLFDADNEKRANEKLVKAEIKMISTSLGIVDPDAAYKLMDTSGLKIEDSGEVKGVKEALEALLKTKPYLKKTGTVIGGGSNPAGAGGKVSSSNTMNEFIRRSLKR